MAYGSLNGLVPSVGLEIHVLLRTPTKLFCGCANRADARINSLLCPVCMGLPGSLPVLSAAAVGCGVKVAVAAGARVNRISTFDRKHYFYPDLPRNYQITQYEQPLAVGGVLECGGVRFTLERMHLEEDAARILPGPRQGTVAVDLNRAGTPLLEIVTEPARATGEQVRSWLRGLRRLLRYLQVSDGKLEDGHLRCDANVGFLAVGAADRRWAGPWTELKNLNSPGMIRRAIDHEIERLTALARRAAVPVHETRAWDRKAGRTRLLRAKEMTRDYRYLPDPDLPPVVVAGVQLEALAASLPELPAARQKRLERQYGLSRQAADTLCRDRSLADYFEHVAAELAAQPGTAGGNLAANWILAEVAGRWDTTPLPPPAFPVSPRNLAELLRLILRGKVNRPAAKQVFAAMLAEPSAVPGALVAQLELADAGDQGQVDTWCRQAMAASPEAMASWCRGRTGALEYLVGKAMALSGGRADPVRVRRLLRDMLRQDGSG